MLERTANIAGKYTRAEADGLDSFGRGAGASMGVGTFAGVPWDRQSPS
jgi:hypothetical protein